MMMMDRETPLTQVLVLLHIAESFNPFDMGNIYYCVIEVLNLLQIALYMQ